MILILIIFLAILIFVSDFLITTGLYAIVCWAFGLIFSWKIAIGIYIIEIFVIGIGIGKAIIEHDN